MTDGIDKLRTFWNTFRENFDTFANGTTKSGKVLLQELELDSANNILEVGVGTGRMAQILTTQYPDLEYYGIDLSPNMIEFASKRLSRGTISVGNSEALEFEDAFFDRYFSNYVLHLTVEPANMIAEAYRVLKEGGMAAFAVWGRPENSPQFTVPGRVKKEFDPEGNAGGRTPFHLCDRESTREMFVDAGFSQVFAWYSTSVQTLTAQEFTEQYITSHPALDSIRESGQIDAFKARLFEQLKQECDDKGIPVSQEALLIIAFK
eukprot:TRINITY_DN76_c0_g1_i1.p1 TRINITY_DN76_c0_g1~~TRINITY_DN76_c0_g1_i1.p1  ORF type:complete len:263 (+),score=60.24 TRINITY_DN76_c0_g1_i1:773-1561(+)